MTKPIIHASHQRASQTSFSDMPPPKKGILRSTKKAASSVAKYVKKSLPGQVTHFGYKVGHNSLGTLAGYIPGKVGGAVGKTIARVKGRVTHKAVDIAKAKEKGKRIASKPFKVASGLVGAAIVAPVGTIAVGATRGYRAVKYQYQIKEGIKNIDRAIMSGKAIFEEGKPLTDKRRKDMWRGVESFVDADSKNMIINVDKTSGKMDIVFDIDTFLKKYNTPIQKDQAPMHAKAIALQDILEKGHPEEAAQELLLLMEKFKDKVLVPMLKKQSLRQSSKG